MGSSKDGNKDHPDIEMFSDLHITYEDIGMTGFGDFLIAGDEYREGGGARLYSGNSHYLCRQGRRVRDVHSPF